MARSLPAVEKAAQLARAFGARLGAVSRDRVARVCRPGRAAGLRPEEIRGRQRDHIKARLDLIAEKQRKKKVHVTTATAGLPAARSHRSAGWALQGGSHRCRVPCRPPHRAPADAPHGLGTAEVQPGASAAGQEPTALLNGQWCSRRSTRPIANREAHSAG